PREEIVPGGRGMARLALESPLVARGNDRFVLRSYSPLLTIGGGRVLDPLPPRRALWPEALAAADPLRRAAALVLRRPAGIPAADMPILLGEPLEGKLAGITLIAGRYLPAELPLTLRTAALGALEAFHGRSPAEAGLSLETLRRSLKGPPEVVNAVLEAMVREGELKLFEGAAALPRFVPRVTGGEELTARVVAALEQAGLEPPSIRELEHQLGQSGLLPQLRHAAQQGRIIQVESDRYFSHGALERFVQAVRELAAEQTITPSGLRDRLHLSRKYLIPLLEWADRSGVTRRVGDQRVLA
ncbi:MAG TPA: SelB C-terminal domain-containing protein, partial [Gemmatimonadales bacterium]|nr:SelB C-terminal domain-containing protein [Gemmatimonadales bacterium]